MTTPSSRRSPLAMVVLALLAEAPMHPYRMQQMIKERGKDQVVNVARRNSIYQTIDRLLRDGLITVQTTARHERRPERTTYQITAEGLATLRRWLRTALAAPAREFPEFPAALALAMLLDPDDVRAQLEARAAMLEQRLAEADATTASVRSWLPRLFLIEDEYRSAVTRTELDWVRKLIEDLRSGELAWSEDWLRQYAVSPAALPDIPGTGPQS
jgi:DNA-binding PadR family transcriptional regulator